MEQLIEEGSEDQSRIANKVVDGWEDQGQAKIVVKVESEAELLEIQKRAEEQGINTCAIRDAGRTQVEPDTLTVCALGPADG